MQAGNSTWKYDDPALALTSLPADELEASYKMNRPKARLA